MAFNQELYEVGARIIERREELGMTATQLAIQADISARTLSQIESGQREAKIGTLVAIAAALRVSLDYQNLISTQRCQKECLFSLQGLMQNYRKIRKKFSRFLQQLLKLYNRPWFKDGYFLFCDHKYIVK